MTGSWWVAAIVALSLFPIVDGSGLALPRRELPDHSRYTSTSAMSPQKPVPVEANKPAFRSAQSKARQLRATALALIKRATHARLDQALADLDESARLFERAHSNSDVAADFLSMGEIYASRSQYNSALRLYRQALERSRNQNPDLECSALSHIAVVYATLYETEKFNAVVQKAITMANDKGSAHARAEALEAQGEGLAHPHPDRAIEALNAAIEIFKTAGDSDGEARSRLTSGFAYFAKSSLEQALAQYQEALRLWHSTGNLSGEAHAELALGTLLTKIGEPEQALAALRRAHEIFHRIGDLDDEAAVLNSLGFASQSLGQYTQALEWHRQARKLFAQAGDEAGVVAAVDEMAQSYWFLNQYQRARELYLIKLRWARKKKCLKTEVTALFHLGRVFEHEHAYSQAVSFYRQALALVDSGTDSLIHTDILIHLARIEAEQQHSDQAFPLLNQALAVATKLDLPADLSRAHLALASLYLSLHQPEDAKKEAESAVQYIETERAKVANYEDRASYFSSVHEYYRLYIAVLMQLHGKYPQQGFQRMAFEASEKSKVRSFLDMLSSSGDHAGCVSALQSETKDVIGLPETSPECQPAAASAFGLAQIQNEIRGTTLLEFSLGEDQSYLWMVDETQIQSFSLPGRAVLARMVARLGQAVTVEQRGLLPNEDLAGYNMRLSRAHAEYERAARKLSQTLFGPAMPLVKSNRLIIVPDGELQYVPFAALPVPVHSSSNGAVKLVRSFEPVELPSASILKALRDKRRLPTETAAVFADPVFTKDDSRMGKQSQSVPSYRPGPGLVLRDVPPGSTYITRLPESRREAEAISEALAPAPVHLALDFNANRDAVLKGDLGRFRYIHFATHEIHDKQHPEFSGLLLSLVNQKGKAEDGYLRVQDIYRLNLSADLVVLSSCDSTSGKDMASEGIVGLPRAFLYAGSKAVISTLWKVDDAATAKFMRIFYTKLHQGKTPSAALKDAQLELSRIKGWESPYFWAGFILQGEYR